MKEIKLQGNIIRSINFELVSADTKIYTDSVLAPIIRYTGEFDVKETNLGTVIREVSKNNGINITSFANGSKRNQTIIQNGSNISIINGSGVTIVNGQVISGNVNGIINIGNGEMNSVELIVPKSMEELELSINSKSGDLTIEDLIMAKLIAKTISGDITLKDIDSVFTKINTVSGDISAKILESMLNYKTYLKTVSGDRVQESIETVSPTMISQKHQFEAEAVSGDIEIIFKGKR